MTLKVCLAILLAGAAFRCQIQEQSEVHLPVSEETFAQLYAEVLLIRARYPMAKDHEPRIIPLLREYGLSIDNFIDISAYYQANPDRWLEFLDRVDEIIESRQEEAGESGV
jgi:hypothetical protein